MKFFFNPEDKLIRVLLRTKNEKKYAKRVIF